MSVRFTEWWEAEFSLGLTAQTSELNQPFAKSLMKDDGDVVYTSNPASAEYTDDCFALLHWCYCKSVKTNNSSKLMVL